MAQENANHLGIAAVDFPDLREIVAEPLQITKEVLLAVCQPAQIFIDKIVPRVQTLATELSSDDATFESINTVLLDKISQSFCIDSGIIKQLKENEDKVVYWSAYLRQLCFKPQQVWDETKIAAVELFDLYRVAGEQKFRTEVLNFANKVEETFLKLNSLTSGNTDYSFANGLEELGLALTALTAGTEAKDNLGVNFTKTLTTKCRI